MIDDKVLKRRMTVSAEFYEFMEARAKDKGCTIAEAVDLWAESPMAEANELRDDLQTMQDMEQIQFSRATDFEVENLELKKAILGLNKEKYRNEK